ncbi:MAG: zinc-ribbon domain-containing protein [Myxococcales bacterium]|nr:zinc-ribbon domain-containing protein [Myxococcales bacterium]
MSFGVIIGYTTTPTCVATGTFDCPRCGKSQPFERIRARRYFTLFFVPLVKLYDVAEHVECHVCHGAFEARAIEGTEPDPPAVARLEAPPDELTARALAGESFGELGSTLAADEQAEARYRRTAPAGDQLGPRLPISRKIALTAVVLAALVAIPYVHPALARFRLLQAEEAKPPPGLELAVEPPPEAAPPMPAASVGEAAVPGQTQDQEARGKELDAPLPDVRGPIAQARKDSVKFVPKSDEKAPRAIEDPTGHGLDKFFQKLAKVEAGEAGAVARILYYGDSIVASDFVSGKLRRLLQDRFGDAGHGYALVANAWPGWFHIDVSREASGEWSKSTCVGPYAEDGIYGLGCASFTARAPKLWTRFGTAKSDHWGTNVGRFEIEYLAQPGGGAVELVVDGEVKGELDTEAPEAKLSYRSVEVPDGPHTLELRTTSDKPTRLFGIRMERDVPGVTLSALGITGARARFLDKQDDEAWKQALAASKADLVVLAFGSNEITDGNAYSMDDYEKTLVAVLKQIEAALPDASFLLVGPPDMASANAAQGHSKPMGGIITMRQRAISKTTGWPFWSQLDAMGGGGSMWGWIKLGLGSTDMFHPTGQGGGVLGKWLYAGLMQAFEKWKSP